MTASVAKLITELRARRRRIAAITLWWGRTKRGRAAHGRWLAALYEEDVALHMTIIELLSERPQVKGFRYDAPSSPEPVATAKVGRRMKAPRLISR